MKARGRPRKARKIQQEPRIRQFSPRGKPGRPDETELPLEQYEALRLADCEGQDQARGAQVLGVSRPTFGRILREARQKVSDALVNGKIIRIVGDLPVRSDPAQQKDSQDQEVRRSDPSHRVSRQTSRPKQA